MQSSSVMSLKSTKNLPRVNCLTWWEGTRGRLAYTAIALLDAPPTGAGVPVWYINVGNIQQTRALTYCKDLNQGLVVETCIYFSLDPKSFFIVGSSYTTSSFIVSYISQPAPGLKQYLSNVKHGG